MSSLAELMPDLTKTYGKNIGGKGHLLPDMMRLPTGDFPLDLAIGGGIPMGRITEIYGGEGSGKTNKALQLIASFQQRHSDKKCAFVDIEGTFDPEWARKFGVCVEELYFFRPNYAEQAVDIVEAILCADDCGLVVVDSIAAMVTIRESEQSAEKSDVGGEAQAVKKLVRKSTLALNRAVQEGRIPTLVLINQTRSKIGVMYGSPETTPGGNAKNFFCSMRLRIYGKNEMDASVSKVLPAVKHTTVTVQKWKCPIVAHSAEYDIVMIPHKGMPVGYCNEWSVIKKYLEDWKQLIKDGTKGYKLFGKPYKTLTEIRAHIEGDKEFGNTVKEYIFERAKKEASATGINEEKEDGEPIPEESQA